MLSKIGNIVLGMLLAAGIFGCAQHTAIQRESQLEKNWGRSFESARYNQMLNPEAEENLKPVAGLDGPSAERIMNGYMAGGAPQQEASPEFGVVTIKK